MYTGDKRNPSVDIQPNEYISYDLMENMDLKLETVNSLSVRQAGILVIRTCLQGL